MGRLDLPDPIRDEDIYISERPEDTDCTQAKQRIKHIDPDVHDSIDYEIPASMNVEEAMEAIIEGKRRAIENLGINRRRPHA